MISHIQNEILKQKYFTGSGFEGMPCFFLETHFMSKLSDTRGPNSSSFLLAGL